MQRKAFCFSYWDISDIDKQLKNCMNCEILKTCDLVGFSKGKYVVDFIEYRNNRRLLLGGF